MRLRLAGSLRVFAALLVIVGRSNTSVAAGSKSQSGTPDEQSAARFNAATTLVLIPANVTDSLNRFVLGLRKEDFHVFEDGEEQTIAHFSGEDAPLSLGLVFDCSGSMDDKLRTSRQAALQFLKTMNAQDEAFLVEFSNTAQLEVEFTSKLEQIQDKLTALQPGGLTAMIDAAQMALHEMKKAKNPRKAILIISDGGDNHSRYTENEIKSLVKEADVMVYAIGIYDRSFPTEEERLGPELLGEIAELTGGRAFTVENPNDLADVATKIGVELRNQYVLGYRPSKIDRDGKWRKIKVKLLPPKGLPPLRVYARTGYYAPEE